MAKATARGASSAVRKELMDPKVADLRRLAITQMGDAGILWPGNPTLARESGRDR
jgi:hypothetical protein